MSDLIRREDALAILDLAEHDAEERDWRSGANEIARLIQRTRSIPEAALSDHPTVKTLVAEVRAELALTALHDAYAHQLAACAEWETEMAKARGAAKHKVAAARYAGHYSAMNDLAKRIASLESAAIRGETT